MYIKLQNVGAIKEATVDLTGLSVIAGKNGTGKSTIGKTVYTIIKSVQEQDKIVAKKQKDFIEWACKNIYFQLQGSIATAANAKKIVSADSELLESTFQYGAFEQQLTQHVFEEKKLNVAYALIDSRIAAVDSFSEIVDTETKLKIKEILVTIKTRLAPIDTSTALKDSLLFMYQKVFDAQINNLKSHLTSNVDFGGLLKYSVSNNADTMPFADRLNITSADPQIQQKVFQDATFVETPLVLQVENVRDTENLPTYWIDLLRKVSMQSVDSTLQNNAIKEAIADISNALGGSLEYNTNRRRFEFIKKDFNNGANVFVSNAASGEKILGIFQQLALKGMFGPDKILILDEPENHLHPEWLAVLAEVLVKLAVAKCPILITSHSPDLLQAIRFYAKKHGLAQLKMYLADPQTHTLEDKTGKEYEIFQNLAEPINEIFSFSVSEALA